MYSLPVSGRMITMIGRLVCPCASLLLGLALAPSAARAQPFNFTLVSQESILVGAAADSAPVGFAQLQVDKLNLLALTANGTVLTVAAGSEPTLRCLGQRSGIDTIVGITLAPDGSELAVAALGEANAGSRLQAFWQSSCGQGQALVEGADTISLPSASQLADAGFSTATLEAAGGLGPLALTAVQDGFTLAVSTHGSLASDAPGTRRLAVFNGSSGDLAQLFRFDVASPDHLLRSMTDISRPGGAALLVLVEQNSSEFNIVSVTLDPVDAAANATIDMVALPALARELLVTGKADYALAAASPTVDAVSVLVGNDTAPLGPATMLSFSISVSEASGTGTPTLSPKTTRVPTSAPFSAPGGGPNVTAAPTLAPTPAPTAMAILTATPTAKATPTAAPTAKAFPTSTPTDSASPTAAPTAQEAAGEGQGGVSLGVPLLVLLTMSLAGCYVLFAKRRRGSAAYRDPVDGGDFEMMDLPISDSFAGGDNRPGAHQGRGTHSQFLIGGGRDTDIAII